jgi:hypothetical protein
MSIFVLLLSMISFAFGAPINRESVRNAAPQIEACADGGCVQQFRQ